MESKTASARVFPDQGSELVWLAFLLTGDIALSGDVAGETLGALDPTGPFFEPWMSAWRRKLVITRALGKVRLPLMASACRVRLRVQNSTYGDQLPSPTWSAGREVSRAQFEDALLAIDIFPRCALLLRIFEKIRTEDAALLLNADKELVESATATALNELAWNIAIGQNWSPIEATRGVRIVQTLDAILT